MTQTRLLDRRGVQIAIGTVFLVVALLNVVRTEIYIQRTQPRDAAQEACLVATTEVLRKWTDARQSVEEARDVRDALLDPFFEQLRNGHIPSPEVVQAVQDANNVVDDRAAAREVIWKANPLPKCDLK